jgi:FAD/FMN-containing dehydrogenase
MTQAEEFAKLKSLVSSEEIIEQGTPEYEDETLTWSSAKNQHPKLLIRPKSLEHLSKVIAFLNNSDLDFVVRSLGFGSASAKDVLVSLKAFDDFEWDEEKKVVTLGVGQTWVNFYRKMEKVTPDYAGKYLADISGL